MASPSQNIKLHDLCSIDDIEVVISLHLHRLDKVPEDKFHKSEILPHPDPLRRTMNTTAVLRS